MFSGNSSVRVLAYTGSSWPPPTLYAFFAVLIGALVRETYVAAAIAAEGGSINNGDPGGFEKNTRPVAPKLRWESLFSERRKKSREDRFAVRGLVI